MIDIEKTEMQTYKLISELVEKCDCETIDEVENVLQILSIKTKESLEKISSNKPLIHHPYKLQSSKEETFH